MSLSGSRPRHSETIVRCTADVPARARLAYWNDTVSIPFPGISVEWLAGHAPHSRLKSRPFADARITEIVGTPGRVRYKPTASSLPTSYLLVLQLAGNERCTQADHEVFQEPGDLVLLDPTQSFDAIFPQGLHILVWHLPRDRLTPLLQSPERVAGVRISGRYGLGAVLAGYARALVGEVGQFDAACCRSSRGKERSPAGEAVPFDDIIRESLELHLCSLTALALGASEAACETRLISYRAARRQQILTYVEAHLREPTLTVERAARDLKMSGRWLHALFTESETSFAAWVARRRVEECRKLLDDPRYNDISISEIAFRHGFNELSTFNRQFRARYGMTPRDVRHAQPPHG